MEVIENGSSVETLNSNNIENEREDWLEDQSAQGIGEAILDTPTVNSNVYLGE